MSLTPSQIRKVLQNKKFVEQIILSKTAENEDVIYGARAINAQVPNYMEKETEDYDIYTKYPSKSAKELAKELNNRLGDKLFYAKKAKNPSTWKVKSKFGRKTIADYTRQDKDIPIVNKMGVRYASVDFLKQKIRKQLRNPNNKFRRSKDIDSLNRIKAMEEKWEVM